MLIYLLVHTNKNSNNCMVLFNNSIEKDPTNRNKEDTWICITYYTDGSKITSIQIYDVLFGSKLK